MLPYIFILFFSSSIFSFFSVGIRSNIFSNRVVSYVIYLFIATALILFSGLRDYSVGTDTYIYKYFYDVFPDNFNEFIESNYFGLTKESGFHYFQFLGKLLDLDYQFVMLLVATSVVLLSVFSILKITNSVAISLYLFITLSFYTIHFNAARQGVAIALFLFAFSYYLNGNLRAFFIIILTSIFFHKSAIFCLLVPLIDRVGLDLKKAFFIAVLFFVLALFIDKIVMLMSTNLDERYKTFGQENESAKGVVQNLTYACFFLFIVFSNYFNQIKSDVMSTYIKLTYCSTLIGMLSVILKLDPNGISRLALYFNQLYIFALPYAVYSFKNQEIRALLFLALIIFSLIYFILSINTFSSLVPYKGFVF